MRNYFNYFTEIEEHFVRSRARNLLLSPLDWCLIESWKESGIPLSVVLRGIDRSFQGSQKKGGKPPRTLFYCHPAVMEAFEEFKEGRVGASQDSEDETGAPDRARIAAYIESLLERLQSLPRAKLSSEKEVLQRVTERLTFLHDQVTGEGARLQEIDRELIQAGQLLTEALRRQLPDPAREQINKQVTDELRAHRKRLGKEMYQRLEQTYLGRRVREHFSLPEFSILEV